MFIPKQNHCLHVGALMPLMIKFRDKVWENSKKLFSGTKGVITKYTKERQDVAA